MVPLLTAIATTATLRRNSGRFASADLFIYKIWVLNGVPWCYLAIQSKLPWVSNHLKLQDFEGHCSGNLRATTFCLPHGRPRYTSFPPPSPSWVGKPLDINPECILPNISKTRYFLKFLEYSKHSEDFLKNSNPQNNPFSRIF